MCYRFYHVWRYFDGYSYITRRTPVYGSKRIFNGYKKVSRRVPNHVNKRVLSGYKVIMTQVPKYEWKNVQVGWTTEKVQVPKMVQVKKPDGVIGPRSMILRILRSRGYPGDKPQSAGNWAAFLTIAPAFTQIQS